MASGTGKKKSKKISLRQDVSLESSSFKSRPLGKSEQIQLLETANNYENVSDDLFDPRNIASLEDPFGQERFSTLQKSTRLQLIQQPDEENVAELYDPSQLQRFPHAPTRKSKKSTIPRPPPLPFKNPSPSRSKKQPQLQQQQPPEAFPISAGELAQGRNSLKTKTKQRLKKFVPIKVPRKELYYSLQHFQDKRFYPMTSVWKALGEEMVKGDIVSLDFRGIDQLTDALFYYLKEQKIDLTYLSNINLDGCVYVTDLGIKWLLTLCGGRKLKEISIKGCRGITSVGIKLITDKCPVLETLHADATSVSCLPLDLVSGSAIVKLNGCPMVHSRSLQQVMGNSGTAGDRKKFQLDIIPHYKVVVLADEAVPCSMGSFLTTGGYHKPEPGMKFYKSDKWLPNHASRDTAIGANIFEITGEQHTGLLDTVLTDGCLVVLPYTFSADRETIADNISKKISAVLSKARHVYIVLVELVDEESKEDVPNSPKTLPDILRNLNALKENMLDAIGFIHGMDRVNWMDFKDQRQLSILYHMFEIYELIPGRSNACRLFYDAKAGKVIEHQNVDEVERMMWKSVQKIDQAVKTTYKSADPDFHELLIKPMLAAKDVKLFPEFYKTLPKKTTDEYFFGSLVKAFDILNMKGICVFNSALRANVCFGDAGKLAELFQVVTDTCPGRTVQLGEGARVPYLPGPVPCWTEAQLAGALKGRFADPAAMVGYLEEQGHVLQLRCDRYKPEQESYVYVPYSLIPETPDSEVLSSLWVDPPPADRAIIKSERVYRFIHGLPASFMASLLRKCTKTAQFNLLWKNGAVIQHGCVDCLLELIPGDVPGEQILLLIVRMNAKLLETPTNCSDRQTVRDCLWHTVQLYSTMIEATMHEQATYAQITLTCPHCKPGENRVYRSRIGQVVHWEMAQVMKVKSQGDTLGCGICSRRDIPIGDVMRADVADTLVPDHELMKIQRVSVVDLLPKYSKCFLCNNCIDQGIKCPQNGLNGASQKNCACDTKLVVCPYCGICERCKLIISEMESQLYPALSSYHSLQYLETEQKHDASYSPGTRSAPSPNLGTIIRVSIGNVLRFSPRDTAMSPGGFDTWEVVLLEPSSARIDLAFYMDKAKTKKPFLTYRSRDGEIETCFDGKTASRRNGDWNTLKGDVIQVRVEHDSEQVGLMRTSMTLSMNGQVMRRDTGLPMKIYPQLTVYQSSGGATAQKITGVSEPVELMMLAPSFRYSRVSDPNFIVTSKSTEVCYNAGRQLIGYSGKEVYDYGVIEVVKNALTNNASVIPAVLLPAKVTEHMAKYPHWSNTHTTAVLQKLAPVCLPEAIVKGGRDTYLEESVGAGVHFQSAPGVEVKEHVPGDVSKFHLNLLFRLAFEPKLNLLEKIVDWLPESSDVSPEEVAHWLQKAITQTLYQYNLPRAGDTEDSESALSRYRTLTGGLKDVTSMCRPHALSSSDTAECELLTVLDTFDAQFLTHVRLQFPVRGSRADLHLPENFFTSLSGMQRLDILRTSLANLPKGIGKCRKLSEISLEDNLLTDLPDDFADCAPALTWLDLSMNRMSSIPDVVTTCHNLRTLSADHMFLQSLPQDIGNLQKLERLSVKRNCLRSLPPSIRRLKRLTHLNLAGVQWLGRGSMGKDELLNYDFISRFFAEQNWRFWDNAGGEKIWLQNKFGQLDADGDGLINEDERIAASVRLFAEFPRLGTNAMHILGQGTTETCLPKEIFSLRRLQSLDISYQGITDISKDVSKLSNLQHMSCNCDVMLKELPGQLGELPIKNMTLLDCPALRTPPREIQKRGTQTTLSYLRNLEEGGAECRRTKLMMVGLGGAGKTSLVEALLSGTGKANMGPGEQITDGIDIHEWNVSDKRSETPITYSVWDFAGQTVYYNTHQFFLSNRAVYLLLWNIRLGYEHAGLDFWLSSISVHAPKAPIFVVGTHLDQVSKSDLPMSEMKEKYPQIVAFHFVSTHTAQGVSGLQNELIETTLAQRYMGESIPKVWLQFETSLIKQRAHAPVVPFKHVEEIAADNGILSDSKNRAIQFLHELGSIIHFDNEFLRDKVVVDPQWIVDVMACVVSVKDSPIKEGRFLHKDMATVWKDYDASLHPWLLRLTEEYDLTFPLTDKEVNLVPCLLPEKQPAFEWPELDKNSSLKETKMIYKFVYLPAGLFNRGQVRLYQYSDSSIIWKKGSLLRKKGHLALVTQTSDTQMVVKVQGPQPENLTFMVHEVFEGLINESFHGVHYEYFGPCPDCVKSGVKDPFMFSSSTLRRAKVLKASFLQCSTYFHNISISSLNSNMPPDSSFDYDQQLLSTVQTLSDLKREMGADVFLSYCEGDLHNNDTVSPSTVRNDLEKLGYNCYFPPAPSDPDSLEKMAIVARDTKVFVVFVSDAYAEDATCCSLFKFMRHALQKPWVMVVIGEGQNWKKSSLGVFISDELYVNMAQKARYESKIGELKDKLLQRYTGQEKTDKIYPPCFLSYCWTNSQQAILKGSRKKEGALGWGDPREFKDYMEDKGVKCWIDVENIGQRGLFEDIAEGLRNAKVVVACVSDEYAVSNNCMMEFRFATSNLDIPTILAVVGTGNNWKRTEIGMLSQKNLLPELNFQEEAPQAQEKLLKMVERYTSVPEVKDKDDKPEIKDKGKEKKKGKDSQNVEKRNTSYTELFELAQRNFLRQISTFADESGDFYPRLLVLDFIEMYDEDMEKEKDDGGAPVERPRTATGRPTLGKRQSTGLKLRGSVGPKSFQNRAFGVKLLCEHEEGWHSYTDPVPLDDDFVEEKLEKYAPYLARITAILRHSNNLYLKCASGIQGAQYFKWLEEQPSVSSSDFGEVYKQFRREILQADKDRSMGRLAMCHLPNGKTVWLCPEHQKLPRVTVISDDTETVNQTVDSGHDEALYEALTSELNEETRQRIEEYVAKWSPLVQYKPLTDYNSDDDVASEEGDAADYYDSLGWSSDEDEPGTSGASRPHRDTQFSMKFQSLQDGLEEIPVTDPDLSAPGQKGLSINFTNIKGQAEQVPVPETELEGLKKAMALDFDDDNESVLSEDLRSLDRTRRRSLASMASMISESDDGSFHENQESNLKEEINYKLSPLPPPHVESEVTPKPTPRKSSAIGAKAAAKETKKASGKSESKTCALL